MCAKQVKPVSVALQVNGRAVSGAVDSRTTLVNFLRDELHLTGTRVGCDTAQCGACTVLMDGRSVKSCNVLVAQAHGCELRTVEGLADAGGGLSQIQESFARHRALQCGYCTSGMLMRACELLATDRELSEQSIREALEGNLCRCTGYGGIVLAILEMHRRQGKPSGG
jgi:carbon-monoxide dehydrogenase small subunit